MLIPMKVEFKKNWSIFLLVPDYEKGYSATSPEEYNNISKAPT